ncbi:metallophosphoesterase [Halorarum salinum]|uniref:Phosphoesterase n=1 Tax=Halorarum salinum TaxID=2743089 RepID=A0A7D5QIE4_9EURY|nr:metallophosphoesterase [Halobaculum salinum]QLG60645.1 metallophosphoesterase [Halobaculum salinum]
MLTVVSDTHATDAHRLRGRTLEAVREADRVIHAGDFYREPVLDAFLAENESLFGVVGNNDDTPIRERLPHERVVAYEGAAVAVRHRSRSGATGLAMFGRERDADLVVFGHSHRPEFDDSAGVPLLNPGSHAQPRGNRPAHAELEPSADGNGLDGRLVTPDGDVFERFTVDAGGN